MIHPLNCMFSGHLIKPYETDVFDSVTIPQDKADDITKHITKNVKCYRVIMLKKYYHVNMFKNRFSCVEKVYNKQIINKVA